jgi:AcrR family transcriptional regulator
MNKRLKSDKTNHNEVTQSVPPGRIKISEALKSLLMEKSFSEITWAEIAKTAGVSEALIYQHFQDKRGLLHEVLADYLEAFSREIDFALKGIQGALNKLRKLMWSQMNFYKQDRIFTKILLLEVRNFPGYYRSRTYRKVQGFGKRVLDIIEEGIGNNEIREDISPRHIRQVLLGSIEHMILPCVIFDREITPDTFTEDICKMLFEGIEKRPN